MPELAAFARTFFNATMPKCFFQPLVNRNQRQLLIQLDEAIIGMRIAQRDIPHGVPLTGTHHNLLKM